MVSFISVTTQKGEKSDILIRPKVMKREWLVGCRGYNLGSVEFRKEMTFDLQIMPHYTVKLVLATTMVTTWEKRTRHMGLETVSTESPGRGIC